MRDAKNAKIKRDATPFVALRGDQPLNVLLDKWSYDTSLRAQNWRLPGKTARVDYYLFKIHKIVDESTVILVYDGEKLAELSGQSTKTLTDDLTVRVLGWVLTQPPVKRDGIQMASFKLLPSKEAIKKRDAIQAAKAEDIRNTNWPIWESKVGSKVRAKFQRYTAGRVQLLTEGGKELKLKITDFSKSDQEKIRKLIQEQKAQKPK